MPTCRKSGKSIAQPEKPSEMPFKHAQKSKILLSRPKIFANPKIPYKALKPNLDTQKPKDLNTDCNIIVTYVTK